MKSWSLRAGVLLFAATVLAAAAFAVVTHRRVVAAQRAPQPRIEVRVRYRGKVLGTWHLPLWRPGQHAPWFQATHSYHYDEACALDVHGRPVRGTCRPDVLQLGVSGRARLSADGLLHLHLSYARLVALHRVDSGVSVTVTPQVANFAGEWVVGLPPGSAATLPCLSAPDYTVAVSRPLGKVPPRR